MMEKDKISKINKLKLNFDLSKKFDLIRCYFYRNGVFQGGFEIPLQIGA